MGEKSKRKFYDNFIFYTLTVLLLVFGGQIIGEIIFLPLLFLEQYKVLEISPELRISIEYFMTIGCWIACLLWFIFRKNRFMYGEIKPKKKGNTIPMLIIGCVIGFAMNAICVLVAYLCGDINLEFDSFKPVWLIVVALCVLVQSSSEEVVCRVYLYQKLKNRYKNPLVAIIGNSVLFSCLHLINPGISVVAIINIVLIGIFFSLFIYYFDSMWCASAIHAGWNYTQNIIFGLPNSGKVSPFSILRLTQAQDSFAYNVDFGVEATVFSLIVEVVGIIVVVAIGQKIKSKRLAQETVVIEEASV